MEATRARLYTPSRNQEWLRVCETSGVCLWAHQTPLVVLDGHTHRSTDYPPNTHTSSGNARGNARSGSSAKKRGRDEAATEEAAEEPPVRRTRSGTRRAE